MAIGEVDEEELMDELGLGVDGSSKVLRDRIFAVISFHLERGSLQLVSDEDETGAGALMFGPQPLLELEV